jgi:hypothetical protein
MHLCIVKAQYSPLLADETFWEKLLLRTFFPGIGASDVNVHKTNSFLRPNFQLVSISKRNVLCLLHCDRKENKMCFVQKKPENNEIRTK